MKRDIVLRWCKKAERDLKTAKILIKETEMLTDTICFHCQQAIEKYLKAFLTEEGVRFGKIHDLGTLFELCIEKDKNFEKLDKERISELTFYAVDLRYPEEFYIPSVEEAKTALELAEEVKEFILKKLKIREDEL